MRRVFVHIGLMKTGTTALQAAFEASAPALAARGILYPTRGLVRGRHAQLAWSLWPPEELVGWPREQYAGSPCSDLIGAMLDEATAAGADTLLLSAEEFSLVPPDRLKRLIDDLPVRPRFIVYLRAQDEMIESLYRQFVRGRGIRDPFDRFLDDVLDGRMALSSPLDYDRYLDELTAVAGERGVVAAIYDAAAKASILGHFLTLTGLPADGICDRGRQNPSLDGAYLEFVRRVNAYLPASARPAFLSDLGWLMERAPQPPTHLLDDEGRARVRARFHDGNVAVARRFFGRDELFPPAPSGIG